MDIVVWILTQIGYGAIIIACVEHGQIEKGAHLEIPPDPEIVVHVDLANGHPLEIGANCIHLALVDAYTSRTKERIFGVVHSAEPVTIPVIGDLMVIPCCDPSKLLMR